MSESRRVCIIGTGHYVPEKVLTNFDLEKMVDTNDAWIVERTGIRERHLAAEHEATSDLAIQAAREAMKDAGVGPEEIDLIVVATSTPDKMFPATAVYVQRGLEAKHAAAFDLGAACSGFLYALTAASSMVQTGAFRTALVIGAEKFSPFVNWKDRGTCILMGDGSGAVVLRSVEGDRGFYRSVLSADGKGADMLHLPAGGSLRPASHATIDANEHFMIMNGREVFKVAVRVMADSVQRVVKEQGLTLDDITLIFPHQANIRILQTLAEKLGVPMEKIYSNIERYGNTSSASIPIALDEAARAGKLKDGDWVVLTAIGAGFVWGAALLRWGQGLPR